MSGRPADLEANEQAAEEMSVGAVWLWVLAACLGFWLAVIEAVVAVVAVIS